MTATSEDSRDEREDLEIIEAAREVASRLSIRFDPLAIQWGFPVLGGVGSTHPYIETSRSDYSRPDQCVAGRVMGVGTLFLAPVMRGRLTPNEWKPLIAASLIFYYDRKIRLALWSRYVPAVLLALLPIILWGIALLTSKGAEASADWLVIPVGPLVILLVYIILSIGLQFFGRRWYRTLWLRADLLASRLVGKDNFIQVLLKIKETGLPERTRHPWVPNLLRLPFADIDRPILSERAKNLSGLVS